MSNLELINKLPDSIYANNPESNNYKMWKLFAVFMDEIDQVFNVISLMSDPQLNSGIALDLLGKILRQKRLGWGDSNYIKYLLIAMKKYQSSGSIEDLNSICGLLAGDDFRYIRSLYEEAELPTDNFWFDGEFWLDGGQYLSGDIIQASFIEIVFSTNISPDLLASISTVIQQCKVGGVKYRIRTED